MPGRSVHRQGGCMTGGGMHSRGYVWQRREACMAGGACVAGEMATAADGMHPIGMLSCFASFLSFAHTQSTFQLKTILADASYIKFLQQQS